MELSATLIAQLEQLASLGIRILPLPLISSHFVLERDGFAVLVERRDGRFGDLGNPGLLDGNGYSALVELAGQTWFIGRGARREATPDEAAAARKLFTDLKSALS